MLIFQKFLQKNNGFVKFGGIILSQDKISILLADDNKDFCDILKNYLDKQSKVGGQAVLGRQTK